VASSQLRDVDAAEIIDDPLVNVIEMFIQTGKKG